MQADTVGAQQHVPITVRHENMKRSACEGRCRCIAEMFQGQRGKKNEEELDVKRSINPAMCEGGGKRPAGSFLDDDRNSVAVFFLHFLGFLLPCFEGMLRKVVRLETLWIIS